MEPPVNDDNVSEHGTEEMMFELAIGDDMYGPESNNLQIRGLSCRKNPGHQGFIPIKDFTRDHLPPSLCDDDNFFQFINFFADSTVHITAYKVSTERNASLPLFNLRGCSAPRTGSGWVEDVYLCGLRGQGEKTIAEFWEECLKKDVSVVPPASDKPKAFGSDDTKAGLICEKEHKPDTTSFLLPRDCSSKHYSDFLIDAHEVTCKDKARAQCQPKSLLSDEALITKKEEEENNTEKCSCTSTNLNEYRKAKGWSVTEMMAILLYRLFYKHKKLVSLDEYTKAFRFIEDLCPCIECRQSENPVKTWWRVEIVTAAHVIFDNQEAEGARVALFYDDTETPPVIMRGLWVGTRSGKMTDIRNDFVTVICALHDHDAGKRLRSQCEPYRQLCCKMGNQYLTNSPQFPDGGKPVIAISHPYGSTKHISIGKLVSGPVGRNVRYTTPTCPGSSGCPVGGWHYLYMYPHSRSLKSNVNQSGLGVFWA